MLEIKNITKVYEDSGQKSKALNGISINFRECEFAAILGPSGSGKTTFLNIIGGLDHYSAGDLIINETSTKKYKDSDWDSYRNHRIGFIFQSYNLIPHQTILKNVALALNLSGVSRKEAERRAKKALEEVGLSAHINKRPSQLSGGQMQRVAIARALVNNPEIILADEPTGALDSETSVQIMDLLKEISKKKLIIMVTHNPELAEKYSTRIVTIKDGKITNDTNPYDGKKDTSETLEKQKSKRKRTKMSLLTSFRLSASNLLTKKARTLLIAIAGSIGIIGIALVLAISNGFQRYVDDIEEGTLTSYPLMLTEKTSDMTSLLLSATTPAGVETEDGVVKENQLITKTLTSLSVNDLKSFKSHLETNESKITNDVEKLTYNYSVDPLIYTYDKTGKLSKLNPSDLFSSILGGSSSLLSSYSSYTSIFSQLPSTNQEDLEKHHDLLAGRWPEKYNELVINLEDKNSISELLVYSLGFRDMDELKSMITKIMAGESIETKNPAMELTYEDLMGVELKLISPADLYRYNPEYNVYEDMSEDEEYMKNLYANAETLKIVGVASISSDTIMSIEGPGIYYTPELVEHIIDYAKTTDIVKAQQENDKINVFSGKPFDEEKSGLGLNFTDFVAVDEEKLKSAFGTTIDQAEVRSKVKDYMSGIGKSLTTDITPAKTSFNSSLNEILSDFNNSLLEKKTLTPSELVPFTDSYFASYTPSKIIHNLTSTYIIPTDNFAQTYSGLSKAYLAAYAEAFSNFLKDPANTAYLLDYLSKYPEALENPESAPIVIEEDLLNQVHASFTSSDTVNLVSEKMAHAMTEAVMQKTVLTSVGDLTSYLTDSFANSFNVDPSAITSAFKLNVTEEEITRIISAMLTKSEATQKSNLISLGYQDIDSPTSIYVYFSSFEGKDNFLKFIENYNNSVDEEKQIKYSDTTGILMSSVKTIVDAVTYVLIGFVSVSLVVSSIMIGVITYISVYERTKEIGILRAIGASKRNISNIFNAETFIIGLLSGLLAIGISYLLIIILNIILLNLTGIANLQAFLSPENSIILIILSVILTLIGGFIPSKSASKKDPVEALRSE